ncbi:hypothetical protein D3C80_1547940 [compost metagenome]
MEGFDHLHVEATEETTQHEQQNNRHHHHFGHAVPAALFDAFTNQNAQHQTRYGVAHNQLRRAAKNGGPEAGFFTRVDCRQPEDDRHDGVDQQVRRRNQHLHGCDLKRRRYGRSSEV